MMKSMISELMELLRQLIVALQRQALASPQPCEPQQPAVVGVPAAPPQHVAVEWVVDYLKVSIRTFYRHVYKKLLHPRLHVGNRAYFLMDDVTSLILGHTPGAHTFRSER